MVTFGNCWQIVVAVAVAVAVAVPVAVYSFSFPFVGAYAPTTSVFSPVIFIYKCLVYLNAILSFRVIK